MPYLRRVVKPKTKQGKRFLENREPKLIENDRKAIFIRGVNANNVVLQAMKDFAILKKPMSVIFNKKNDMKPFEDASSLEFFSRKNDASLFMFGSNNKKRPSNLVIGRLFDYNVLDMFELGIENFKALKDFKNAKIPLGTKPMLLFTGDAFDGEPEYQRLKNLFIDFFRGPVVQFVRLQGLEHLIVFSADSGKVHLRSYRVTMKKSGTRVPNVKLEEIGPHMDLTLRRTKLASNDLLKHASRKPLQFKQTKKKNIKRDTLGSTHGRIHMERQDYGKLQTRKMKGLKVKNPQFEQNILPNDEKRKQTEVSFQEPDSKRIKAE